MRDKLQGYVKDHLGDADGVLVVDETGFLKKGTHSVGVARQYSGTAGKVENCQIGVFLTYASAKGFTLIDRRLYLPKAWSEDRARCRQAGVPDAAEFQTKPKLAAGMIERADQAGIPYRFVTGDCVYGDDATLRRGIERRGKGYVLAVSGKACVWQGARQRRVSAILSELSDEGFQTLSLGEGSKGERLYGFLSVRLTPDCAPGFERCLLVRQNLKGERERQAFLCYYPSGTPLKELVRVAGIRWTVEQSFQEAKGEVGLDHYEVRSYNGWYRHITLAMAAHALLTAIKATAACDALLKGALEPPKGDPMAGFKKGRHLRSRSQNPSSAG